MTGRTRIISTRASSLARLLATGAALAAGLTPGSAVGQALPTAEAPPSSVGFQLPTVDGTLQYAVSTSETINHGFYEGGTTASTNVSGDLAFRSTSKTDPTSLVFSGGYLASTSSQPSSHYLNLSVSQALSTRMWNFSVADSVSYLPQSPTTSISGVAGVGDLGVDQTELGGQEVLTNYATRVSNNASGSLQRKLTASTSLQGSGSFNILRFTGQGVAGIDTDQLTGGGGLTHRINALSSVSGNYNYSQFTYGGSQFNFVSQSAVIQYSRQFTRQFSMNASVGPQRTSGSNSGLIAPTLNLSANINASYTGEMTSESLSFSRGSSNGSGVATGSVSDSVSGSVHRRFGRAWNVSGTVSYSRNTSLPGLVSGYFSTNTLVGSGQVSRAISRSLSGYASYTLERQSNSESIATVNVFTGVSQIVGFGLTYSHSPIRLGRP